MGPAVEEEDLPGATSGALQRGRGGGGNSLARVVGIAGHAGRGRGRRKGLRAAEEAGLIQGRREEEGREKQGDGRA